MDINSDFYSIFIFMACIFLATAVHETMHAYVALRLGDDLAHSSGRISLNPLRHIDPFLTVVLPLTLLILGLTPILAAKPVPINPNRLRGGEDGMALVGAVGPFSNLAMAGLTGFLIRVIDPTVGTTPYTVMITFFMVNVGLFVFNMLPIPPLDGSRVLYAIAPESVQNFMRTIEGFGVAGVILFLAILYPVISPFLNASYNFLIRILL